MDQRKSNGSKKTETDTYLNPSWRFFDTLNYTIQQALALKFHVEKSVPPKNATFNCTYPKKVSKKNDLQKDTLSEFVCQSALVQKMVSEIGPVYFQVQPIS